MLSFSIGNLGLCASVAAQSLVPRAEVERIDAARGLLSIRREADGSNLDRARLAVLDGGALRLAEPAGSDASRVYFRIPPGSAPLTGYATQAWLTPADLAERTAARWPEGVARHAPVTRSGAGLRSVWLAAGERQGVRLGDVWMRRVRGQPIARCEVRLVESERSFALVDALVSDLRISDGDAFASWSRPGETAEAAWSAVVHVEADAPAGSDSPAPLGDARSAATRPSAAASQAAAPRDATPPTQLVWVAAPAGFESLPDPRVDFFREGRFVAHGVAERRDRLFWYVRTLPAASRGRVAVGDDVRIRTPAQIAQRTFTARVLATQSGEELINAGELDGLRVGDVGEVYRGGALLGRVVVHSVQRGYSAVRWSQGDGPGVELKSGPETPRGVAPGSRQRSAPGVPQVGARHVLAPLDEVRFASPAPSPAEVGTVDRVVDGLLMVVRLGSGAPFGGELGARSSPLASAVGAQADAVVTIATAGGRPVGCAVLFDVQGDRALGVAIRESLDTELTPGLKVLAAPAANPPRP